MDTVCQSVLPAVPQEFGISPTFPNKAHSVLIQTVRVSQFYLSFKKFQDHLASRLLAASI